MTRIRRILTVILCIIMLTTAVYAESGATNVESWSTVTSNGACQVTMTVRINMDHPATGLTFPLPRGARDVAVNGASARTYSSATDPDVVLADLSFLDGYMGENTITFSYILSDVLHTERNENTKKSSLIMSVPLLCGFDYPVKALSFSITMPGDVTGKKPSFTSGFLQTNIDSIVNCVTGGSLISGTVTRPLQDREKLTLVMEVDEKMFPGKLVIFRDGNPEALPMGICAAAALLYWLLLMRCLPLIRQRRTLPLEGITAGELGCHLTAAGADLTMMVFTWAELGYLRIYPDKRGRVYLQKYMDMDNERTAFENRCFYSLFSRGDVVDATSGPYARLCLKVAGNISGVKEMYLRHAGNAFLFRALCCGICLFSGICYGNNFTTNPTLRVVLSIGLSLLGVVSAWIIQDGMYRLHIRGKLPIYLSTLATVLWITLGILSGSWLIGLLATLAQLLAGLAAAYGGRRSDLGRSQAGLILGFRHYLGTIPQEELERTVENDPDFFFRMLPYAIAMGVDTRFAKLFGEQKMPHCTYMVTREDRKRTAAEWALLLRKTADRMDALQRKMQLEKLLMIGSHRR
ncbi:MAG: DUF2207 domain-containing protein [Oscillospiraceae bacterium]|nr:DUF2207 domain-containing protein [Oscillospiraceae bacterium]